MYIISTCRRTASSRRSWYRSPATLPAPSTEPPRPPPSVGSCDTASTGSKLKHSVHAVAIGLGRPLRLLWRRVRRLIVGIIVLVALLVVQPVIVDVHEAALHVVKLLDLHMQVGRLARSGGEVGRSGKSGV